MASAATVAPSATASQKSSASANPTALDRASARYRAAQSRYRQAKAALKAIKRQIVPVDAFGNRKPRLRGWLHLATLPLCIAASIVLICIAPAGSVKAACAVYGASAMLLFGNSALLHVVPWRSAKVTRVLCGIDYSNIFLIIAGTNTPVLFVENCVSGITANETRCRYLVENSVGVITAICPHVGYQKAADIAKQAIKTGESVRELILKEGLLTEEELNEIMDPVNMTEPGISGKELLVKNATKNA